MLLLMMRIGFCCLNVISFFISKLAESSGIEPHTTKWNNLISNQFRHHAGLLSI